MNISEDFNHKIIIHAVGKYQIQLLALIYANINYNYNQSFKFHNEDWYNKFYIINKFLEARYHQDNQCNIKTNLLYCPKINLSKVDNYTIHTKHNLEKYLLGISCNRTDNYLQTLENKVKDARDYKIINMKVFLDMYGKYLFNDRNDFDRFINKYNMLENTNIFKTIKQLNI